MVSKNNEAKMVLYNALPKKEYERIFMCITAKYIWLTNNYSSRFNTINTSLKALDESFSSRNNVKKFLGALPTKWLPKVTAIEESKDLLTLPLDELFALKETKVSSDEEVSCSGSDDEEYAMAVRDFKKFFRRRGNFVRRPHDAKKNFQNMKEEKKEKENRSCLKCGNPNHFISDCPKYSFNDQKAFFGVCLSDTKENSKKDKICLLAHDNNEVFSDTPCYSSSSPDTGSESRPSMLNKENYVPWSSRLLRYAKSRPNGNLIHNSILNGPYDIYAAGSESRPPMINKENYVPWSSRLLRYAKTRPNGKLIDNSILNGPYVRRMIPEPGDAERDVNVNE
nr:hypothetical protein [Tanacetum cinerariifolium]